MLDYVITTAYNKDMQIKSIPSTWQFPGCPLSTPSKVGATLMVSAIFQPEIIPNPQIKAQL